jgi:hypothetical protein
LRGREIDEPSRLTSNLLCEYTADDIENNLFLGALFDTGGNSLKVEAMAQARLTGFQPKR